MFSSRKLITLVSIHDNHRKPVTKKDRVSGNTPYCGANGIVDHVSGYTHEGKFVLLAEDGGNFGRGETSAYIMDGLFWANNHVHVLQVKSSIVSEYLLYYLNFMDLTPYTRGATRKKINQQQLKEIDILLPYAEEPEKSLEEQRRIVARIESLFTEVERAKTLHASIVKDTEQLMDSVLGEIFSDFLQRETTDINVIADVKGGKRLPKGTSYSPTITEYPYIRVRDFFNFTINYEDIQYLTKDVYKQISRYTINSTDVYISIAGTIGLVGTIPTKYDGSNLTENAAKIVFREEYKNNFIPKFLAFFLGSIYGKKQISERTKSAGQPKLALMRIKTIKVPLGYSIDEQKSICLYIETFLNEIQRINNIHNEYSHEIDTLQKSILSQAFKGEL